MRPPMRPWFLWDKRHLVQGKCKLTLTLDRTISRRVALPALLQADTFFSTGVAFLFCQSCFLSGPFSDPFVDGSANAGSTTKMEMAR